jgi:hypothetical protein
MGFRTLVFGNTFTDHKTNFLTHLCSRTACCDYQARRGVRARGECRDLFCASTRFNLSKRWTGKDAGGSRCPRGRGPTDKRFGASRTKADGRVPLAHQICTNSPASIVNGCDHGRRRKPPYSSLTKKSNSSHTNFTPEKPKTSSHQSCCVNVITAYRLPLWQQRCFYC